MDVIFRLLPERIKQAVLSQVADRWNDLQEIRLRLRKTDRVKFSLFHRMDQHYFH